MTAPFSKDEIEGSIPERFRRAARAHPNRPAVSESGRTVTYEELEARVAGFAGALAGRLHGASREAPVALLARAGAPLFAAMLGTLDAGRFYVPLDPALPDARLRSILLDLDAAAVVTEGASSARARGLAADGAPVFELEELLAVPATGTSSTSTVSVSAGDLAYVLFTSGSTGRPKGVMQSHRNVLHNVWKLASGLGIGPEDRITLLSSPSFGASVSDIYGALLTGACVCPFDLSGDGLRRLPDFLEREGDHDLSLRAERLPESRVDARRPRRRLEAPDAQARRRGRARLGSRSLSQPVSAKLRLPRRPRVHRDERHAPVVRVTRHALAGRSASRLRRRRDGGPSPATTKATTATKERSPSSGGRCRSATGRIPNARPRPSCRCRGGPTSGCSRPAISAACFPMAVSCISAVGTSG